MTPEATSKMISIAARMLTSMQLSPEIKDWTNGRIGKRDIRTFYFKVDSYNERLKRLAIEIKTVIDDERKKQLTPQP